MIDAKHMRITLASRSPRRAELLGHLDWSFDVSPADINERVKRDEPASEYVRRMAFEKAVEASSGAKGSKPHLVIGSDTSVVLDGSVFGKPRDRSEAVAMLEQLSGKAHQVLTAVSVVVSCENGFSNLKARGADKDLLAFDIEQASIDDNAVAYSCLVATTVYFKRLSSLEIRHYCDSGEPFDKAGAYAIQGRAGAFVSRIEGSYSAVVGLPLYETNELIAFCQKCCAS